MLFSKRDLVKMIVPLFVQQILAITVGMVDNMMVAYAGDAAVSGVSLVGSLDNMLIIIFTSMTAGGTVVISQIMGSRKYREARDGGKQLLYASTAVAALITVAVQILRVPLLKALFGSVEAAVMDSAKDYFLFTSLSYPVFAVQSACNAILRVEGKTSAATVVSVAANLLNVAGNALLIMICNMGAAGAAISTLISRVVAAGIMLIVIGSKKNTLYIDKLLHFRPDFKMIRKMLRIGIPNGIESGMFNFGKLITQSLVSTLPTSMIAANAVASTIAGYQYMPGGAIGMAVVPVIGRCIGALEQKQAKYYSRLLLGVTYVSLWITIGLTFLFAEPLIGAYGLEQEASDMARQMLFYHCLCAAVIWPIAFTTPYSFRAAGDVKFPMVISMVSMWAFRVALAHPLALPEVSVLGMTVPGLNMGIMGVWIAMTVDWLFRAVIYAVHYLKGKWLKMKMAV